MLLTAQRATTHNTQMTDEEISVMKQTKHSINSHRYESRHGEDATSSPINGSLAIAFGRRFEQGLIRLTECR